MVGGVDGPQILKSSEGPGRGLKIVHLDAAERGMTIYGTPRGELPTWPRLLRNMGSGSPGKQAYVADMRTAYGGSITGFNATYSTDFASWDALLAATDWRPRTDRLVHGDLHFRR